MLSTDAHSALAPEPPQQTAGGPNRVNLKKLFGKHAVHDSVTGAHKGEAMGTNRQTGQTVRKAPISYPYHLVDKTFKHPYHSQTPLYCCRGQHAPQTRLKVGARGTWQIDWSRVTICQGSRLPVAACIGELTCATFCVRWRTCTRKGLDDLLLALGRRLVILSCCRHSELCFLLSVHTAGCCTSAVGQE